MLMMKLRWKFKMCSGNNLQEADMFLDEELLELFKHFKEINEHEAGEPLKNEDLIVDFIFTIQEKIGKLVEDLN